jgi:hypothetical protein
LRNIGLVSVRKTTWRRVFGGVEGWTGGEDGEAGRVEWIESGPERADGAKKASHLNRRVDGGRNGQALRPRTFVEEEGRRLVFTPDHAAGLRREPAAALSGASLAISSLPST